MLFQKIEKGVNPTVIDITIMQAHSHADDYFSLIEGAVLFQHLITAEKKNHFTIYDRKKNLLLKLKEL